MLHPLFLLRTPYFWETYLSLAIFVWLLVLALQMHRRSDLSIGKPILLDDIS